MTRLEQFEDTIEILNNIIIKELPGYIIAGQLIQGFEYARNVENGIVSDIRLLQSLCNGLPYRDIEALNETAINSVYKSFNEMKKLLQERLSK